MILMRGKDIMRAIGRVGLKVKPVLGPRIAWVRFGPKTLCPLHKVDFYPTNFTFFKPFYGNFTAFYCPLQILKKYFCLCKELLLSADCYCPRTYLPRTITVRRQPCPGLLLSTDVLAADYNSHVQKEGIVPNNRPSTCFLQDLFL